MQGRMGGPFLVGFFHCCTTHGTFNEMALLFMLRLSQGSQITFALALGPVGMLAALAVTTFGAHSGG
jgi:hypothetical protein